MFGIVMALAAAAVALVMGIDAGKKLAAEDFVVHGHAVALDVG